MNAANRHSQAGMMNLDTIILAFGVCVVFLLASFFGVDGQNILLYLFVGMIVSGYKVVKTRHDDWRSVIATIIIGLFLSVIGAPVIETRTSLPALDTSFLLGGMVLLGELGIFFMFEKLFGWKINPTDIAKASKPVSKSVKPK